MSLLKSFDYLIWILNKYLKTLSFLRDDPRSIVAIVLDCDLEVSGFELQLRYYILFRKDTFGKGINLFILKLCFK